MNRLWVRLSLAFSSVVLLAVLLIIISSTVVRQFDDERETLITRLLTQPNGLVEHLSQLYDQQNNWNNAHLLIQGAQPYLRGNHDVALVDLEGIVIYHSDNDLIGQPLSTLDPILTLPIDTSRDAPIGTLIVLTDDEADSPSLISFWLRRAVDSLFAIAITGGILGIIFGIVISRSLTAPLDQLAEAARSIGARQLNQRVEPRGTQEMIAVAEAFNEMATDLEQAEKLRRNLLADVAHELRTPLSVLQANLRAILDEVYPLDQAEITRLYDQTRFLSRMVNDLHELAQAEAHKLPLDLETVDVGALIESTMAQFRPNAEAKQVQLQTNLADSLPTLQVDSTRLKQVLQNLLSNALKHTPPSGEITIHTEAATNAVQITISDNGEGIPLEHLPHIFDRFYRTDPARSRDRGGTGLGLAITRAIIEAHGGHIHATSSGISGEGSCFTIQLPVGT